MGIDSQSAELRRPRAWLAWSSGKDSAWALHAVQHRGEFEVVALLTTVNQTYSRVAMHAVRECLVEMQAAAAGVPLIKIPIPAPWTNTIYWRARGVRGSFSGRYSRVPGETTCRVWHDAGFSAVAARHAATGRRNARARA